ncbi:MAG: DNA alkylation repair protein [Oscillospiraceae bacterium]|jgi:3-methyladenine DNA glycosylase AlkD|nr:DNA alkylation repair protein [Oscillospiraceae bacterium]
MRLEQNLLKSLFALQDLKYKEFHCRLMPTVDPETVIGVRVPPLRKLAVQFGKTPQAEAFLHALPHRYYEENNVHGCLISAMTDYEQTVAALDAFLPYVDNWATCDLISPKAFKKHPAPLLEQCRTWMASDHAYTVRFGIGVLLSFYLDDAFAPEQLEWAADLRSGEYYVNMMTAWYFATALAKQYDAALPYIQHQRLDPWTHNKAIQKAVESYRITPEQKALLRKYKVKL